MDGGMNLIKFHLNPFLLGLHVNLTQLLILFLYLSSLNLCDATFNSLQKSIVNEYILRLQSERSGVKVTLMELQVVSYHVILLLFEP